MPIEVHILQDGMGRLWVRRGVLTGKEIIANNERILSSKSYEGVRWLLIDDTETTMDVSAADIRTITQQDDRLAAVLPDLVTAVRCCCAMDDVLSCALLRVNTSPEAGRPADS